MFTYQQLQDMFGYDVYPTTHTGLSVGDRIQFDTTHEWYTPTVIKGFSLNGLYCYFEAITRDNETYVFTACSVRGEYVFLPHYKLVLMCKLEE